jgi:hypothetical protein
MVTASMPSIQVRPKIITGGMASPSRFGELVEDGARANDLEDFLVVNTRGLEFIVVGADVVALAVVGEGNAEGFSGSPFFWTPRNRDVLFLGRGRFARLR